jgi:hypothetical protein
MVLTTTGAHENSRKTCSLGNPSPGGNPGLKSTGRRLYKKFFMKTIFLPDVITEYCIVSY